MKKLRTTSLLKELMTQYFQKLGSSKQVAWCTSVGPAELLRSFGFEVYFPENHGALLGATRLAGDFIPDAEQIGYAGDICSYLTADIGAFLQGRTPLTAHYGLTEIPKPDLIVYSTNQCREVQDWFTWYADKFNCPVFGIHPPRHLEEVFPHEIEDVVGQFQQLANKCEEVTGQKLDLNSFSKTVQLSKEAAILWKAVLETGKLNPSPFNFFDGCIHMGPIVVLRGTQDAVEYYKILLEEVREISSSANLTSSNSPIRLYWDGMPIWGKLRMLSELFEKHNATIVASTYCNSWVFDTMDESQPFESTAKAYTSIFINRSENKKMEMISDFTNEYKVDGIIFHDARTCFNNSNSRFGMPKRLEATTGLKTLVLEGDLCELKFFSEEQSVIKVEAFIDQISESKREIQYE